MVCGLLNTTPRKRKALSSIVSLTPSKKQRLNFLEDSIKSVGEKLEKHKSSGKTKDIQKRKVIVSALTMQKYKNIQQVSKELGIRYKTMLKWSRENGDLDSAQRNKRNDALSMESVQEVSDFFIKPYISVNNPEKKRVGIDLRPKHFLNMSKKTAYETFRKENKSVKISESKFWKLKPKNVVPLKRGRFRSCLCEKCINVELKLKALNDKSNVIGLQEKCHEKDAKSDSSSIQSPKTSAKYNKYEANKLTLCAITKDEEHKLDCIERRCQKCGVQQLRGHFGTIANSDKTVN